jgi:hypothetical protein
MFGISSEDYKAEQTYCRLINPEFKMAASNGKRGREELQEAIRVQGEVIRKLKITEQTDEVKSKVTAILKS